MCSARIDYGTLRKQARLNLHAIGDDLNRSISTDEVSTLLPFEELINPRLEHLLVLRDLPAFIRVRDLLAQFRLEHGHIEAKRLQRGVDGCAIGLVNYARGNELQKENFRHLPVSVPRIRPIEK